VERLLRREHRELLDDRELLEHRGVGEQRRAREHLRLVLLDHPERPARHRGVLTAAGRVPGPLPRARDRSSPPGGPPQPRPSAAAARPAGLASRHAPTPALPSATWRRALRRRRSVPVGRAGAARGAAVLPSMRPPSVRGADGVVTDVAVEPGTVLTASHLRT